MADVVIGAAEELARKYVVHEDMGYVVQRRGKPDTSFRFPMTMTMPWRLWTAKNITAGIRLRRSSTLSRAKGNSTNPTIVEAAVAARNRGSDHGPASSGVLPASPKTTLRQGGTEGSPC